MGFSYPNGAPVPTHTSIPPCPAELQGIIDNIKSYSFKELLAILDKWDKQAHNIYIEEVRKQVQELKRNKKTGDENEPKQSTSKNTK
jgi:hypothetical protein